MGEIERKIHGKDLFPDRNLTNDAKNVYCFYYMGERRKKMLSDEPFHYNFHEKMNYEFSLSLFPYKTEATLGEKLIW